MLQSFVRIASSFVSFDRLLQVPVHAHGRRRGTCSIQGARYSFDLYLLKTSQTMISLKPELEDVEKERQTANDFSRGSIFLGGLLCRHYIYIRIDYTVYNSSRNASIDYICPSSKSLHVQSPYKRRLQALGLVGESQSSVACTNLNIAACSGIYLPSHYLYIHIFVPS